MCRLSLILGLLLGVASGQGLTQPLRPPPGWNDFMGPAETQPFTPNTVFNKPLVTPPPTDQNHSDSETLGAGADGGLLQKLPLPLPPLPKLPQPWSGGIDVGLTGATGNTELTNFSGTWNLRRKTERSSFYSDLFYTYSMQDGDIRANQALFNTRSELPFQGYDVSLFSASQLEYDALRSYRFRVGTYLGSGYTIIDGEQSTFKIRSGGGATRELGVNGSPDRWVAELVFGYDFRHRVSDRSAMITVLDCYPRLGDQIGQFRIRARAAYEIIIDPQTSTVLRLGVQDRYDSNPGDNTVRNDLTYFTTLGIKF
jgi:hypothetical protein